MLHAMFHGNRPACSGEVFEGFYHTWAWRSLSFPLPKDALIGLLFLRCLKSVHGGQRTPDHGYTISSPSEPPAPVS